jgi:hypothetical protein
MALKQFGITTKAEGDNLMVTFEGVTTTIKNNGADIQYYLQEIGRTRFAGEAAKEADTLNGALNKLSENIGDLFEQNGESVGRFKNSIVDLNKTISDPKFKESFDILAAAAVTALSKIVDWTAKAVSGVQGLAEAVAAAIHGPAIDDLPRINEELKKAQDRYQVLEEAKNRVKADGGWFAERDLRNIQEQQKELQGSIDKYKEMIAYSEAGKKAQESAKAAGATAGVEYTAAGGIAGTMAGGGEGEESPAVQKAAKEAERLAEIGQQKLERVMQELATEQELINEAYAAREEIILANTEAGSELQYELLVKNNERREAEIKRHQDLITKIETKAMTDRQKFEAMTAAQRTSTVLGGLLQMTTGVATHSKTMFKLNKAMALAQAAIDLPAAIMGAYKIGASMGGPYLGAAYGALAGAAQLSQMAAIKSASFEGGGAGTTPSAAGSVPTVNSQPIGGSAADVTQIGKQAQVINISFDSRITDTKAIRSFIENEFSEALGDGVKITAAVK